MADIAFRALYPKDNNPHGGGLALLADGTLIRYRTEGSGDAMVFMILPLKIDDKRRPEPATWTDKTV